MTIFSDYVTTFIKIIFQFPSFYEKRKVNDYTQISFSLYLISLNTDTYSMK